MRDASSTHFVKKTLSITSLSVTSLREEGDGKVSTGSKKDAPDLPPSRGRIVLESVPVHSAEGEAEVLSGVLLEALLGRGAAYAALYERRVQ